MSNKLAIQLPAGFTVVYHIRNGEMEVYNGSAFVTPVLVDRATYDRSMTADALGDVYTATFPAIPAASYNVFTYLVSGSVYTPIGGGVVDWDGTNIIKLTNLSANIEAIKDKTDNLPEDPAAVSDVHVMVNPFVGQINDPDPLALSGFQHAANSWKISVNDAAGDPVDLDGITLAFVVETVDACTCAKSEAWRVEGAGIVVDGSDVTVTNEATQADTAGVFSWILYDLTDPAQPKPLLFGTLEIKAAASVLPE
jgi:hypothetical protein